jgi:hypothetical protein
MYLGEYSSADSRAWAKRVFGQLEEWPDELQGHVIKVHARAHRVKALQALVEAAGVQLKLPVDPGVPRG